MHRLPRAFTLRQQRLFPLRPQQALHIARLRQAPHTLRIQRRWKSQIVYGPGGEAVRYQAVRFKKPGITFRRVASWAIYAGIVYGWMYFVWRRMDIEIEIVEDEEAEGMTEEEQDGEVPEEDELSMYAAEDSLFIPFTWSKKMPRSFYRGSDPEWQEFTKIAKDGPRGKKVMDDLVAIVYMGSTKHPAISAQLGQKTKVGKFWLNTSFPDGPPQEYERQGLEFGDGYIAWSTQKVAPEQQWRVQRALVPTAIAQGFWTSTKMLVGIQWRRLKQNLGWEEVDPHSPEERFRLAWEMAQKQQASKAGRSMQTSPDASSVASASSASSAANPPAQKKSERPWHMPSVQLPMSSSEASPSSPSDMPIAMHVFVNTLAKSWHNKKAEPPRGAFVVQGMVEVKGSKGRMLFDVIGFYDPRASKFVTVNAGVRVYQRWNQSPKGGP